MSKAGGKAERKQDFISTDQMSDPLMSISPFYSFNTPLGWGAVIPILPMWKLSCKRSQPVIWGVTGVRIQILVSLNPDLVPAQCSLWNLFATHQPPQKTFLSISSQKQPRHGHLTFEPNGCDFLSASSMLFNIPRFPRSQLWPLNTGKS